ncbi:hypothetical protein D3C72_642990 [compost metagenome]
MTDADQRTATAQGLGHPQFDGLGGAAQHALAMGIEGQLRGVFVAGFDGAIDFIVKKVQRLFQRTDTVEALLLQPGNHLGGVVAITGCKTDAFEGLAADHLDFIERYTHFRVLRQRWSVQA